MLRRTYWLPAVAAAVVALPGGSAPAQDGGCTLPPNPGATITFGLEPPDYPVGAEMGWGLDFDDPAESDYASRPVFELDGPAGHQAVTLPFTVPAEGTYTVTAHWTESCGDAMAADRAVTSRPGTFRGVGPQPPYGSIELRQGGARLQGGRREPATALLHVGCPDNRIDEPLRVTARIAGRTVVDVRPHGCLAYRLSRSSHRHGRRWSIAADDLGAEIFVSAPARLTAHVELRSGARVVAAAALRFRPAARGRERVTVLRAGCHLSGGCPGS
jgi:hypothetical protein